MNRCAAERCYLNWKEWLLVLLASLAIHLILFVLCRPLLESYNIPKTERRFTILLTEDYLVSKKDPYLLKYWLKYADPQQLIHPDMKHGFSKIIHQNKKNMPEIHKIQHDLFTPIAQYSLQHPHIAESRDIADLWGTPMGSLVQHSNASAINSPEVQYPVWTDNFGKIFTGLFQQDKDILKLIKTEKTDKMTVLKTLTVPGKIPQITLVRSCGIPALDQLAKRQLFSQKAFYNAKNKMERYFYISWQPPQYSLSGKGTK